MHQSRSVKLGLSRFLPFEIAYADEGGWVGSSGFGL